MQVRGGIEWGRTAPASWTAELESFGGPPNRRVPWLALAWMAGEPYELVQRWVVYELVPWERLLRTATSPERWERVQDLLSAYLGPSPASQRTWRQVGGVWKHVSDSPITQDQWTIGRAARAHANLFWIVQGSFGGHKVRFNPFEQVLLRTAGRPQELPAPGDLRYVGWDGRVLHQLAEQARLAETCRTIAAGAVDLEARTEVHHYAERKARESIARAQILRWLDAQLARGVESAKNLWRPSDLAEGDPITDREMADAEADFVADTTTVEVA